MRILNHFLPFAIIESTPIPSISTENFSSIFSSCKSPYYSLSLIILCYLLPSPNTPTYVSTHVMSRDYYANPRRTLPRVSLRFIEEQKSFYVI